MPFGDKSQLLEIIAVRLLRKLFHLVAESKCSHGVRVTGAQREASNGPWRYLLLKADDANLRQ